MLYAVLHNLLVHVISKTSKYNYDVSCISTSIKRGGGVRWAEVLYWSHPPVPQSLNSLFFFPPLLPVNLVTPQCP